MRILLIRPPAKYIKGSAKPSAILPLGLLYIAAVLENNNYTVEIYDAQINIDVPVSYDSDDNIHMGDSWEAVEEQIRKIDPDIVGITNPFSAQLDNTLKVAQITKKINKNILVVVGGNHPTVQPNDFFDKTEAVDIVCLGEGEYTMLEIAGACKEQRDWRNILGTAVKKNNQIKTNPARDYIMDLDILPLPAYHLINLEHYFLINQNGFSGRLSWSYPDSERAVSVITSRGCPFNCIFCSIHLHMGRRWRPHSPEYTLKHLELLAGKYNIKHVHFEDDNLTLDSVRFKEILNGLFEKKMNITWDTPNGIRADMLSKELLENSKKSGCIYIIFGVESGDQRILAEVINKQLDLAKVIKVAQWCKEIGLDAIAYYVIGFPGETPDDMKKTVDFALQLMKNYDVAPSIFIATPLPGTRLYEVCKKGGYLRKELSSDNLAITTGGGGEESLIKTEDFGPGEITIMMRRFIRGYKIIFLRNLLLFIAGNPGIFPEFIKRLWLLKQKSGFKQGILELASLKNCFKK
jgi:anaerobic magnesium-protoporphyrin IX monomethyl ester cyclase